MVMAANGYPGKPQTGTPIRGIDRADTLEHVMVFHAGTKRAADGTLVANGGRVLAVTALGLDHRRGAEASVSSRGRDRLARRLLSAGYRMACCWV